MKPPPSSAQRDTPRTSLPDLSALSRFSVLVVEDNIVNQKVIVKTLRTLGITPEVANDGSEAVNQARLKHYDLVGILATKLLSIAPYVIEIFMDCQMPNMDGFQATREIRQNSQVRFFVAPTPLLIIDSVGAHQ